MHCAMSRQTFSVCHLHLLPVVTHVLVISLLIAEFITVSSNEKTKIFYTSSALSAEWMAGFVFNALKNFMKNEENFPFRHINSRNEIDFTLWTVCINTRENSKCVEISEAISVILKSSLGSVIWRKYIGIDVWSGWFLFCFVGKLNYSKWILKCCLQYETKIHPKYAYCRKTTCSSSFACNNQSMESTLEMPWAMSIFATFMDVPNFTMMQGLITYVSDAHSLFIFEISD